MKENIFKAVAAALIGGISAYLGLLAIPIIVLIAVMVIDYISGMIKAFFNAELSSKIGIKGIIKKLCYLFVVAAAAVVDWLINAVCSQFGVQLETSMYVGLIVTVWLIINELISILENLAIIGVPLPKFFSKIIDKLKVAVENKGEEQ